MGERNRESRSSDDLIREAKERFRAQDSDLDEDERLDEADVPEPGARSEPETTSRTSPEGHGSKPVAASPDRGASGVESERRPRRNIGKLVGVLAVGLLIAGRFGLFGDLLSDPTGEQLVGQLESELTSGGLSEDTWSCVESGLRDAGYVEMLNNVSVSEMNKILESPTAAAPSELVEFLGGFSAYANPHQPTTCVSMDELAALQRPALLMVLVAGVQGAEIKERTTRCDVGYDTTPSYDDFCRVTNVYDPTAGYTLVLHGQVPPADIDGFIQAGVNEYPTDCFAAYLFVVEDGHSPVWTDSIRRFTPQGEMTEVCVQTST